MQIFNSGFFWFVEGILFVVMILGLRAWARDRGLPMPVWKWALFLAWVLVAGFTIAFVGTSFGEGEAVAAQRGGLLFGLITVISGVGVWRLLLLKVGSGRR
ncbi:dehalogenase [Gemmatimonadota bacterium]